MYIKKRGQESRPFHGPSICRALWLNQVLQMVHPHQVHDQVYEQFKIKHKQKWIIQTKIGAASVLTGLTLN